MKQTLIFALTGITLLFSTLSIAQPSKEQMMATLKHSNPMPSLMMVVRTQSEALDLSDEQVNALKAWREQSRPRMKEMLQILTELEQQLHDAALAGAPGNILRDIAVETFSVRGAIIKQKLACRNRIVQVIGVEKMKKLVELYKAK